jgi:hypothetical protein
MKIDSLAADLDRNRAVAENAVFGVYSGERDPLIPAMLTPLEG